MSRQGCGERFVLALTHQPTPEECRSIPDFGRHIVVQSQAAEASSIFPPQALPIKAALLPPTFATPFIALLASRLEGFIISASAGICQKCAFSAGLLRRRSLNFLEARQAARKVWNSAVRRISYFARNTCTRRRARSIHRTGSSTSSRHVVRKPAK